jgi:hypothetical protein
MDRSTLAIAASLLGLSMLCLTALAIAHVIPGDPVVHLAGVLVGGILGFLSPQMTNRTTTSPTGAVVHTEKVGP